MHSSKGFNSNYMEFVGCKTYDKLRLKSGEGCRNKNTIIKQGIPRRNTSMDYTSATFYFDSSLHKYTYDIFSENLVSHRLQAHSSINEGVVLRYISKVKSRHVIRLPKTCGCQNCGETQVLMLELHLLNLILQYQ